MLGINNLYCKPIIFKSNVNYGEFYVKYYENLFGNYAFTRNRHKCSVLINCEKGFTKLHDWEQVTIRVEKL